MCSIIPAIRKNAGYMGVLDRIKNSMVFYRIVGTDRRCLTGLSGYWNDSYLGGFTERIWMIQVQKYSRVFKNLWLG